MVMPAIKEQILDDLDRLSPDQQKRAAELVHGLVSPLPKGASIEDLMKVAGTLDDESAREMLGAIEEGCERVDLDDVPTHNNLAPSGVPIRVPVDAQLLCKTLLKES